MRKKMIYVVATLLLILTQISGCSNKSTESYDWNLSKVKIQCPFEAVAGDEIFVILNHGISEASPFQYQIEQVIEEEGKKYQVITVDEVEKREIIERMNRGNLMIEKVKRGKFE